MPNTGALIAAVPAASDPINEISEEDVAHCTMFFFGEAANLPADVVDGLEEAVADMGSYAGPFTAKVAGTGQLGPDKANVLLIESEELVDLYWHLLDIPAVGDANALADKKFPWWLPHLTINYGGQMPADLPETIEFDTLGLWLAGEKKSYPLAGGQPMDLTAALSLPEIHCVQDLSLGIRYASSVPDARWYVAKRARALGAQDRIPKQWSQV